MTSMVSTTSDKMQTWQQSGGAIAAFAAVPEEHADMRLTAAAGSNGSYIGSCVRFDPK
ncbi:hypothetical protein [Thalassospira sp.]|uniref:hypothetical protein n=1 Tax=Thalassospira sp. TaxID=1912094 RepID=UPI0032EB6974